MDRKRGLTVIELLVIVILCVGLVFFFMPAGRHGGGEARKALCQHHLSLIAKGMQMYLLKYGDNRMYSMPAESFRGGCWLASLYWSGIINDPQVFFCPGSADREHLPPRPPKDLSLASAIPADAVSYAGLCHGLTGKYAHRNTTRFTQCRGPSSACILACDDNEGTQNHPHGICAVYFDGHVEFIPGPRSETYDLIGAAGSPYQHLDSGEE